MITDQETNFLYLADTLPKRMPQFFDGFEAALRQHAILFSFLPKTKDIWAVDYMPIQVRPDKYVQFVYFPDYLRSSQKWRNTISNVDAICSHLGVPTTKSTILLDGGNVVRSQNTVIMCNKVFKENPAVPERKLIRQLEEALEVSRIVFVPQDPNDEIGHVDGMVRFLDDSTVLINRYAEGDVDFGISLRTALYNAGLEVLEVPYNPYGNKSDLDATGIYINFLQMKGIIFLPTFGIKEDEDAIVQFETLFRDCEIVPVHSTEVAKQGGVLNCISWNVSKADMLL